jgi:catechol 2,3-dioxygenase-like lactoylglutathione lyase family enzyme
MRTRFLAVELLTDKPVELREFYGTTLGLAIVDLADGFAAITGKSLLRFRPTYGSQPTYHVGFNIPENQIESARDWLQTRAELIPHHASGDTLIDWPAWNAHSVYFLDPAGNMLEVIARHSLPNALPGNFGAASFCNISELGLVVPDTNAALDLLASTFDLPKKSVLDDFGAVGDDDGLFIVSAQNRPWMPTTQLLAQPFPARAVVNHPRPIVLNLPGTEYTITTRKPSAR